MAEQYVASDKRNGLEVAVTGEFPPHHDDRIRIARTTQLFTRLMSTILGTENDSQRRERFVAVETQLEMAEALIREDIAEVQRLLQQTMEKMGISREQLDEMTKQIIDQFGGPPGGLGGSPFGDLGGPPPSDDGEDGPQLPPGRGPGSDPDQPPLAPNPN